jgi:hypothetical protein
MRLAQDAAGSAWPRRSQPARPNPPPPTRSDFRLGSHPTRTGTFLFQSDYLGRIGPEQEADMNGLIYLVGLIVVILAVLSFFGLR